MALRHRCRALALLTAGFLALAAPASAADDVLEVSTDGATFGRETAPLFPGDFRIVPGDVISEDLWVRNNGGVTGRLRIQLVDVSATDADLARALTLGVVAPDGRGDPTPRRIDEAGECTILNRDLLLAPGETLRLRAEAALGDLDGSLGQKGVATFGFRVVITDVALPVADDEACDDGDDTVDVPGTPDDLAATGVEGTGTLALVAAGLVGAGLVLAFVRRSARDDA